jgi:hypothetical protein
MQRLQLHVLRSEKGTIDPNLDINIHYGLTDEGLWTRVIFGQNYRVHSP